MRLADVRKLALAMPGVVEGTSYGTPAFKVRGKLLARIREEGVLVVVTEPDAKEALLASDPRVYFTVPHYDGYDMVLVRLAKVKSGELRALLFDAYRLRAPEKGLRAKVRAAFLALDGVEEHVSQFSGRPAFWVGGREIAHFHDGNVIEIRGARKWQEVSFATAADVRAIAELAAESVATNSQAGRTLRRPRARRH